MESALRGVFLTSDEPRRTARFYTEVAGLPLEAVGSANDDVFWRVDRDGLQLAIHGARAFADYAHPVVMGSNLTHLYFKIDDQGAFLAHIEALGVVPMAVDEVVVTVKDPDGRAVMFGTA